jgi:potassium efflux system protein
MNRTTSLISAAVFSGAAVLLTGNLIAQPPDVPPPETAPAAADSDPALMLAKVEEALAAIEADTTIEDTLKDQLRPKYKQAIDTLKEAVEFAKKAAVYGDAVRTAPEDAAKARAELQALPSVEDAARVSAIDDIEELQRDVDTRRDRLKALRDSLSTASSNLTRLNTRPVEISARLPEAEGESSEFERQLARAELAGDDPVRVADRYVLQAARSKLQSERDMLQQEQGSLSVREDLLRAQVDLLTRQEENAEAALNAQETSLHKRREYIAQELVDQATSLARGLPEGDEAAQRLAAEVRSLAKQFQESVRDSIAVSAARKYVTTERNALTKEYENTGRQLALGGRGRAMAQVLFNLENLARTAQTDVNALRLPAFERIRLSAIQTDTRLREQPIKERQSANHPSEKVSNLVSTRRLLLKELESQYGKLTHDLAAFDADRQQHLNKCEEILAFTREQLFWMRTSPPVSLETLSVIPRSLRWAFNREHFSAFWGAVVGMFTHVPLPTITILLGAAALLLMRHRLRAALEQTGVAIRRISTDRYAHTVRAVLYTFLLAIPIPLLIGYAAWVLGHASAGGYKTRSDNGVATVERVAASAGSDTVPAESFGADTETASRHWLNDLVLSLQISTWIALAAAMLAAICHPGGLGTAHFGWDEATLAQFRRGFCQVTVAYIPSLLLTNSHYVFEEAADYFSSIGRISFVLCHLWIVLVLWQMFRGSNGILTILARERPAHLITRMRRLWFPVLLALPMGLILLAWRGYLITAIELSLGLVVTVVLLASGAISYGLTLRWFTMRARKLALAEAIERRRALREAAASEDEQESSAEIVTVDSEDEEELDLETISEQTHALLRLAFGLAAAVLILIFWSGTFPLDEFLQTKEVPLTGGQTLLSVTQALLVVVVTYIAAHNLPGLVELAVLRTRELEAGTRYAISTLCQYAVIAIGLAVLFKVLQVDWAKFTWIAAALSVGLGFGLQEVVANFVCGLILLFEQPIRVGDVVTVENTTGTVTKIRMRATTITNWDRHELVIPNKTLITNTFLNWTLSAAVNRVVIPVGVAYGSDTQKARQILLDLAADHPLILDDPAPMATFEQFADSSLTLYLRAFLPNPDNRLKTITELHSEIDKRFAEAGIEIAFPQRDLHLRSGWSLPGGAAPDGAREA